MRSGTIATGILGVVIVSFIGAFALLHPDTPQGELALGALLPLAGAIGTYFFHTTTQGFLGQQQAMARQDMMTVLSNVLPIALPTQKTSQVIPKDSTSSGTTGSDTTTAPTASPSTQP